VRIASTCSCVRVPVPGGPLTSPALAALAPRPATTAAHSKAADILRITYLPLFPASPLAAYAGLAVAVGMFLRQHYLTPLVTSKLNMPGSAWILSEWWTKGDRFAFGRAPLSLLQQLCPPPPPGAGPGNFSKSGFIGQCLSQHGYTQWANYQPASRFWPFQLIEGGWLLALSLLLIATTIWLVRRRAA
jgi:hypothetical protein